MAPCVTPAVSSPSLASAGSVLSAPTMTSAPRVTMETSTTCDTGSTESPHREARGKLYPPYYRPQVCVALPCQTIHFHLLQVERARHEPDTICRLSTCPQPSGSCCQATGLSSSVSIRTWCLG